jgi:hypothetical protein
MYRIACGLPLMFAALQAQAADVESGRRLAQQRCAACHIVTAVRAMISLRTLRLSSRSVESTASIPKGWFSIWSDRSPR